MYKQRLLRHVKKFLNSIKLFLLFSTEISITEYRDVAYVQYRDVQVPRCPDTGGLCISVYWEKYGKNLKSRFSVMDDILTS
jgi:hypothetical protein